MEHHVYYHDTDAGGVVYYANYLKYLEEARTEWLAKRGVVLRDWVAKGITFAVYECNVRYKSPARYGDTIVSSAKLKEHSPVKLTLTQAVRIKASQRLLVEAEVTLVCLDQNFKVMKIPEQIQNVLC